MIDTPLSFIRAFIKLFLISLIIVAFIILSLLTNLIIWSPFKKRTFISFFTSKASWVVLKILGFNISQLGPLPKRGSLIVGNHMSYLDILIYASHFQTLFVTSTDMRARPFLGQLTLLGGCLYVNRKNPKHLIKELKNIKRFFDYGFSVTVFPEGTSSDGANVLPFKKSLFQIALQTNCPIQPVTLCYSEVNGERFSAKNCDKVCWYGDLKFFPHLFNLLRLKSVTASMSILETINSETYGDRKTLCEAAYKSVSIEYDKLLKS